MKEAEMYGDYTFQPKINKVSQTLANEWGNPTAQLKFKEKQAEYIRQKD